MTQQVRTSYRRHRKATWTALLVVMAAALAGMLIGSVGSASGAADKKIVSASISPSSWSRGATVTAALSITNGSGSQQLGSGDLCVPDGLTGVTNAVATPADSPCAGITSNVVRLRNLAISPGTSSGAIALGSIAVPCTSPASIKWRLFAKQSNDFSGLPGNNFSPYPVDIVISITGSCTLAFSNQPSQTSNVVDPSTDPLTSFPLVAVDGTSSIQVTATTGGGAPVSGVAISMSSTASVTSGGSATTNSSGVATFSNLRVGPDGGEYTLTATASGGGFNSPTSNGFFVFTAKCTSSPCSTDKQVSNDTNVNVTQSGTSGPVGILVDTNGGANNQCTGGTPTGDDFRVEIRPLEGNTQITWTYTKSKRLQNPNNGQNYELCVGAKGGGTFPVQPAYDPAANGNPAGDGWANDDGTGRFWGVLTDAAPSTKCDSSYSYRYPTKLAEYSNSANAVQVACFPAPFDPNGFGLG